MPVTKYYEVIRHMVPRNSILLTMRRRLWNALLRTMIPTPKTRKHLSHAAQIAALDLGITVRDTHVAEATEARKDHASYVEELASVRQLTKLSGSHRFALVNLSSKVTHQLPIWN